MGLRGPLRRDGVEVKLRPKAMAVLWRLASDIGNPVSKADLAEAVWPGRRVSDGSLPVCIREIREALGDGTAKPHYVQTVHRYGYRLASRPPRSDERLVGRSDELARLNLALKDAQPETPSVVIVNGEPGLGKTALLNRWIGALDPGMKAEVVIGRCLEPTLTGSAYFPFLDAIGHLAIDPERHGLTAALEAHAPTWLAQFPALFTEDGDPQALPPTIDADQMRRELVDLIAALSRRSPLVLVLENMHWCDEASAHALAHLAQCRTKGPLSVSYTHLTLPTKRIV